MVHNRSNPACGLNGVSVGPDASNGTMAGFRDRPSPGALLGGLDLQDCLLQLLVSPALRRDLGVRQPVSGRLGVSLSHPVGLGPYPVWNARCVGGLLRETASVCLPLRIVYFVGDLRLV